MRESGERKRAILDAALDCIITIDHRGRVLEFNPAAERTFGHRAADAVGRELAELIVPPSLRQRHRDGLARYLETGEEHVLGRRLEITGMRADGSEFPVELAITRINLPGPPGSRATCATSATASAPRRTCAPRAHASSRRPTASAGGWNATCTTAPSSAS